jgi:hypothetical protein
MDSSSLSPGHGIRQLKVFSLMGQLSPVRVRSFVPDPQLLVVLVATHGPSVHSEQSFGCLLLAPPRPAIIAGTMTSTTARIINDFCCIVVNVLQTTNRIDKEF